jgi:UPF0271 protein
MMDLNADLGESYGIYRYGNDEELMPLITSANVACGFHAGDPHTIRKTVKLACEHHVSIGAHVGLPDPLGFGRREMRISGPEAYDYTLYQLGALDAFLRPEGAEMKHVKPHGALYMMATEDRRLADGIAAAVTAFNPALTLFALPGSALDDAGNEHGLAVIHEFFADRPYTGSEVTMFGWDYDQIGSPQDAAQRVSTMLTDPAFNTIETVCVHSDTRGAPEIMASVRARLQQDGILLAAPVKAA